MESAPDTLWNEKEGVERKTEGEWELKGDICLMDFIQLIMDTEFWGYTFVTHNAKGYDGYFVIGHLLKGKIDLQSITQGGRRFTGFYS